MTTEQMLCNVRTHDPPLALRYAVYISEFKAAMNGSFLLSAEH